MKISVITAVFNRADTIDACVQSLRSQSHPNVEHLVIDGGSTDGTLQKLKRHGDRISRLISEPDRGVYDALNKGIALATGDVIGFLHSDDLYAHPEVLRKVARAFQVSGAESCYGDLVYVRRSDPRKIVRYWKSGPYRRSRFSFGWMPPHPAFFVRRSVYERYGDFNLALGSAADYELMLRFLFKHRITTAYVDQILVRMRTGGVSNASLRNRLRANRMDRMAWRVNGLKTPFYTLYLKPFRKISQYFRSPKVFPADTANNSLFP